ncbi:histidine kinase [Serratia plymuthica]|uniref:histidine kinase n=1 Tax=Serratia plymuthica TaxID=82996 RepID=UPI001BAFB186|nr:histidine kinase [Serratia plymuthica]QUY50092.1 histidine kinase [Serratia plymuthica]
MWASWLSAGLLILGALLGSLGAHLQFNPLLAVAGIALSAGMVISGFTECRPGR